MKRSSTKSSALSLRIFSLVAPSNRMTLRMPSTPGIDALFIKQRQTFVTFLGLSQLDADDLTLQIRRLFDPGRHVSETNSRMFFPDMLNTRPMCQKTFGKDDKCFAKLSSCSFFL
jgi:hypothetical protein